MLGYIENQANDDNNTVRGHAFPDYNYITARKSVTHRRISVQFSKTLRASQCSTDNTHDIHAVMPISHMGIPRSTSHSHLETKTLEQHSIRRLESIIDNESNLPNKLVTFFYIYIYYVTCCILHE